MVSKRDSIIFKVMGDLHVDISFWINEVMIKKLQNNKHILRLSHQKDFNCAPAGVFEYFVNSNNINSHIQGTTDIQNLVMCSIIKIYVTSIILNKKQLH